MEQYDIAIAVTFATVVVPFLIAIICATLLQD